MRSYNYIILLRFGDVFESELAVSSPVDTWSVWQSVSPKTTNSHCLAPWPPPHSRPPAVGSPTPLPRSPRPCSVFNDSLIVSVWKCGLLMHSGLPTPISTSTRLVHVINRTSLVMSRFDADVTKEHGHVIYQTKPCFCLFRVSLFHFVF